LNKKPMVSVVTATDAKNRFGEVIKRAYLGEEHLIIERGGIPVVAIVPMADYERLVVSEDLPDEMAQAIATSKREEAARWRLVEHLDQVHSKTPDVSEEEAEQDIHQAIQAVRANQ
jgi:prevent-host-death family protein